MTSSWQKACICRRKWTISDWTMREWCQSLCRSSCTIRFSRGIGRLTRESLE